MKTSEGAAADMDVVAEAVTAPDGFPGHPMMDNLAADVPGSAPLITALREASDWSSPSLRRAPPAHPSQPENGGCP